MLQIDPTVAYVDRTNAKREMAIIQVDENMDRINLRLFPLSRRRTMSPAPRSSRWDCWLRVRGPSDYHSPQRCIKRMFRVSAVKSVITVAATRDQVRRLELRQLILHCLQGEKTQPRQLPYVKLLAWIRKQKLEELRPDHRKQPMQQRRAHSPSYLDRLKRSSSTSGCGGATADHDHQISKVGPRGEGEIAGCDRINPPWRGRPFTPEAKRRRKSRHRGTKAG